MNKFFNTCRRLNPWVVGAIIVAIIGLVIFVPLVGAASLIVALPILGCTIMCGVMAFMMGKKK